MRSRCDEEFPLSCWENMAAELLRDVLMRIEESESTWRRRSIVVACAGVCRSWRQIVRQTVGTLQLSGKLTFPISLKQNLTLLFLNHIDQAVVMPYFLVDVMVYLSTASNDEGKFLLAAQRCRRPTYTDYMISLKSDDVLKGSSNYVGKLRSNFLGTKFTIYDAQPPSGAAARVTRSRSTRMVGTRQVSPRVPAGNYPVAHVSYKLNVLGSRGPRRMQCVMDTIAASSLRSSDGVDRCGRSSRLEKQGSPMARATTVLVASVKNFQLLGGDGEDVILQFGKVGKDTFTMDYQYPLSAFQAFALCLSSFDTKIACE
ncbi:hypothetical protein SASPL_103447 [Salvia splendens]|uniref:Tubby C-terminal domain-containing protein n=1 Tax=Salvia splendens TaxID=180675 RepID=A0A8X9A7L5_SALSN|nr:hypothetical protein SASPL_103447 [Salvia splendens]